MNFRRIAIACAYVSILAASCGGTTPTGTTPTESSSDQHGFNADHFAKGAIASGITMADCTLSAGTSSTCATFTISGIPATYNTGPFCPETLTTTAEQSGIWFDGDGVYDLSGSFIKNLSVFYNDDQWHMYDDLGNVHVTDTQEAFLGAARPDVDPKYKNYCVEGRLEWLTNGQPITKNVVLPTTPILSQGSSLTNGQDWGITLDGIVIAKSAPVNAILSAYTIASFDDCGGHFNNAEGYHLHGATGCGTLDNDHIEGETAMFGYAMDGFPIHLPLTGDSLNTAGLDECGGHTNPEIGYHYHANSPSKNSVLTCLKGEYVATSTAQDGGRGNGQGPPNGGGPDLTSAAAKLGVSVHELEDALGQSPNGDLTTAANVLGISLADLQATLPQRPGGATSAPSSN